MLSQRLTLLIVGPEPSARELLRAHLESNGYRVEMAATGAAASALLDEANVDLVLLDLVLPEADAIAVCQRTRADPSPGYRPIVVLAGPGDSKSEQAALAAGADDSLAKPFDGETLLARVRVWVNTRRRVRAAHEALVQQQAVLRENEPERLLDQISALKLATRQLSRQINDDLWLAVAFLDLLVPSNLSLLPPELAHVRTQAAAGLDAAIGHLKELQLLARSEGGQPPADPPVDSDESTEP